MLLISTNCVSFAGQVCSHPFLCTSLIRLADPPRRITKQICTVAIQIISPLRHSSANLRSPSLSLTFPLRIYTIPLQPMLIHRYAPSFVSDHIRRSAIFTAPLLALPLPCGSSPCPSPPLRCQTFLNSSFPLLVKTTPCFSFASQHCSRLRNSIASPASPCFSFACRIISSPWRF